MGIDISCRSLLPNIRFSSPASSVGNESLFFGVLSDFPLRVLYKIGRIAWSYGSPRKLRKNTVSSCQVVFQFYGIGILVFPLPASRQGRFGASLGRGVVKLCFHINGKCFFVFQPHNCKHFLIYVPHISGSWNSGKRLGMVSVNPFGLSVAVIRISSVPRALISVSTLSRKAADSFCEPSPITSFVPSCGALRPYKTVCWWLGASHVP